jgi:hypothetical protein
MGLQTTFMIFAQAYVGENQINGLVRMNDRLRLGQGRGCQRFIARFL